MSTNSRKILDEKIKDMLHGLPNPDMPLGLSRITVLLRGESCLDEYYYLWVKEIDAAIRAGELLPDIKARSDSRGEAYISRQEIARWLVERGDTEESLNQYILHWLGDALPLAAAARKAFTSRPGLLAKVKSPCKNEPGKKKTRITQRRREQLDIIHGYIKTLKMDPSAIPDGGRATLLEICLQEQPELFTGKEAFVHTWKIGLEHGEFRMGNHDLFARRGH